METNFPRCMKAGKSVDLDQWALADALLKECDDKENGARGYKAVVAEFAKVLGLAYDIRYLRLLRQVADDFPPESRYDGEHKRPMVVLRAHVAAGNAETLDVIVKAGRKDGKTITLEYVEQILRSLRQGERERLLQEKKAAIRRRDEAAAEERQANNRRLNAEPKDRAVAAKERDDARERRRRAEDAVRNIKVAPTRKDLPPPVESEVPLLVLTTSLIANADKAASLAVTNIKLLGNDASELPPRSVPALIEAALTARNRWKEFHDALVLANEKARRSHLNAVG